MNPSPQNDQLEELVIGHFEGSLTPEQEQKLTEAISSSKAAKDLFLSYMRMEGQLHSMGRDGFLREPESNSSELKETVISRNKETSQSDSHAKFYWSRVLASLAACIVIMFAFSWALSPETVSAEIVLQKAQLAAAELIDRTYRLVITDLRIDNERTDKEIEINLRGGRRFLIRPENGSYVLGSDGSDYWLARGSNTVSVTADYQELSPELKRKIPNRWLVDFLSSPQEPLLLDLTSLLQLIRRSYDIELIDSEVEMHHLRATLRDDERSAMPIIDLWIDPITGVFVKAEMTKPNRRKVQFELLESNPLPDKWYQYDYHFPDHKVRRVTAESR